MCDFELDLLRARYNIIAPKINDISLFVCKRWNLRCREHMLCFGEGEAMMPSNVVYKTAVQSDNV